jgi:hypothetical protein
MLFANNMHAPCWLQLMTGFMQAVRTHALLSRLLTESVQQLWGPPSHINSLLPLLSLQQQLPKLLTTVQQTSC